MGEAAAGEDVEQFRGGQINDGITFLNHGLGDAVGKKRFSDARRAGEQDISPFFRIPADKGFASAENRLHIVLRTLSESRVILGRIVIQRKGTKFSFSNTSRMLDWSYKRLTAACLKQ